MENENQLNNLVEKLNLVKTDYVKTKQELAVSIRRDVVALALKNILNSHTDLELREALNNYIENLFKV